MKKTLIQSEYRLALNPQYVSHSLYPREAEKVLNADGFNRAKQSISQWPGYAPTPLLALSNLARELDVASLYYKDESSRFGLGSFKPLGGAYAVASLLQIRSMSAKVVESPTSANCLRASIEVLLPTSQ